MFNSIKLFFQQLICFIKLYKKSYYYFKDRKFVITTDNKLLKELLIDPILEDCIKYKYITSAGIADIILKYFSQLSLYEQKKYLENVLGIISVQKYQAQFSFYNRIKELLLLNEDLLLFFDKVNIISSDVIYEDILTLLRNQQSIEEKGLVSVISNHIKEYIITQFSQSPENAIKLLPYSVLLKSLALDSSLVFEILLRYMSQFPQDQKSIILQNTYHYILQEIRADPVKIANLIENKFIDILLQELTLPDTLTQDIIIIFISNFLIFDYEKFSFIANYLKGYLILIQNDSYIKEKTLIIYNKEPEKILGNILIRNLIEQSVLDITSVVEKTLSLLSLSNAKGSHSVIITNIKDYIRQYYFDTRKKELLCGAYLKLFLDHNIFSQIEIIQILDQNVNHIQNMQITKNIKNCFQYRRLLTIENVEIIFTNPILFQYLVSNQIIVGCDMVDFILLHPSYSVEESIIKTIGQHVNYDYIQSSEYVVREILSNKLLLDAFVKNKILSEQDLYELYKRFSQKTVYYDEIINNIKSIIKVENFFITESTSNLMLQSKSLINRVRAKTLPVIFTKSNMSSSSDEKQMSGPDINTIIQADKILIVDHNKFRNSALLYYASENVYTRPRSNSLPTSFAR